MRPSFLLALLALACAGGKDPADSASPGEEGGGDEATDGADGTDGTDGSDGTDGTDGTDGSDGGDDTADPPGPAPFTWTAGPELPACTPQSGSGDLVALSGVVLTPDGPEAGLVVYSRSSAEITCVGPTCSTASAEVICTEGVISPGLIDTHNHLQYNVIPRWQHGMRFDDRYDWRAADEYDLYRTAYDAIKDDDACEIMKWAELRVLVGGGTAATGSYGGSCINVLVRNLDEGAAASHLDDHDLIFSASTVTDKYDAADGTSYGNQLASGSLDALLNHVGEGTNDDSRAEIAHMIDVGMVGPGQAWIHTVHADVTQLANMAEEGTTLIWSPRSNLDLYQRTAPVEVALRLGVPVALGPDWTWSGSANPAAEAQCAQEYLESRGNTDIADTTLFGLITSEAARATGTDGVLGSLEAGKRADIAVFDWSAEPYRAVIQSSSDTVRLVVVDGEALYGDSAILDVLAENPDWCETVTACETSRTLCVQSASSGDDSQTYAALEALLMADLGAVSMPSGYEYAGTLDPIFACPDTAPPACDLSSPAAGDEDGDGLADSADLCPYGWDPDQEDFDGDGKGDACDPCPMNPTSDECTGTSADIDGDGFASEDDNCPYLYNADQADADGDGTGDACDRCPDVPNPDDGACPTTIGALRDPADPDHPAEGSEVTVSGVVTGVNSGAGYYIQSTTESDGYDGVYVYDAGDATVSVGETVTVSGTYTEYYGLTEVASATTTVTGTATVPTPVAITDPCAIGTGGADAERYESMLVSVSGVTITNANPDGGSDYKEFEVAGCLRVDDDLYSGASTTRTVGTAFTSITGVLSYTFSNNKLLPRSAADMVFE